MARVVLAWELGGGYGHITKIHAIATRLAALGHEPVLVTQNPALARTVLSGTGIVTHPAPVLRDMLKPARAVDSYAEMLLHCGYRDPTALTRTLRDWRVLLERLAPALVVADFSPSAMLAARLAGIAVAALGNGYTIPPSVTPMPFTRAWETLSPGRLETLEAQALDVVNASLARLGGARLENLAALFDVAARFLCSFPELDHYVGRGEAEFYGPVYGREDGVAPDWPRLTGPRVFAYVSADHPLVGALIGALERRGWPTAMHVRGLTGPPDDLKPRAVRLHAAPIAMQAALAECDFVVCQGVTTISAAMVAGRPVLALPEYLEQVMTAHRLVAQRLGVAVPREADASVVDAALGVLLDEPDYAAGAKRMAAHYHGFTPALAAHSVAQECASILAGA